MILMADLTQAEHGSWYTIVGAGGDLQEWIDGYNGLLDDAGIERPSVWYQSTGKFVNEFINPSDPRNEFQDDLTFLMFPLDGMSTGKLAMFKLQMQDRWFDDIVDNAR